MKKIVTIAGGTAGAAIVVFIILSFLMPSQNYAISVDPLMSKGDFGTYTHVFIKNIGRLPVTDLRVDYGNDKVDSIPVLEPGDRVMLSPPQGSDLNMVRVTADNGINVTKPYVSPAAAPMIGNGGFGQ